MKLNLMVLAAVLLCGCTTQLTPAQFVNQQPLVDPLVFFSGHTHSWGMVETTAGAPDEGFSSEAHGIRDAAGNLDLVQNFTFNSGKTPERRWHFVRLDDHRFEGRANDVVGVAKGEAYGNLFHWTYTLALDPGDWLHHVEMEQWMYLQADGTLLNRAVIRKFGWPVAMVTEHFNHLN